MQTTQNHFTRRSLLQGLGASAAAFTVGKGFAQDVDESNPSALVVDLTPKHEISPYLYMQFMEPLGVTDSSVEAAWDHTTNDWRPDVVEATKALGPTMVRWGGILADFYRWREGVGPRDKRKPFLNLQWGGVETNQVGATEFVDFCRRVGAEPLVTVNFESDGRRHFMESRGEVRTADAQEAADWIAYCNAAENPLRKSHGHEKPLGVRYWQIGNETSYDRSGFNLETTARKTVEFALKMRAADPSIKLIAWGDSGWAGRMAEAAGEHVDMLAFHQMFNPDSRDHPVLGGQRYRRDPAATWDQLMQAWRLNDRKIREVRDSLGGRPMPLAMTECHFALPGRNRCDVLSTWAAGVSYARILNNHQRHSDVLKIATAADFCGTRWQVNALMIPVPRHEGKAYLMPVARIMKLYRHNIGERMLQVKRTPDGLDVVASRTGNTLFLHVVNTNRTKSAKANFSCGAGAIASAAGRQISERPMVEVSQLNSERVMQEQEITLPPSGDWVFPAASVTAVKVGLVA
ncbi:MAG: hypothetical protein KDA37_02560 [Planctomycetales bacterium]|nr:hypothetical protein [Planctomycetales bacterium]